MDLFRTFIFIHLALQLPVYSLESSVSRESRLRGAAASTWRREIQAIIGYNGDNTEETFMTLCQAELRETAENGVVSHADYAAFLARYCQSNPAWACTRDTSYFWRLDPRLQRSFISERCPGDDFHQEGCLEYFVGHPEQDFGYSGDLGKLCGAVKHLLVPTGLVWKMPDVDDGDTLDPSKREGGIHLDGGARSQELQISSARSVGNQSGKTGKSKGSEKRAKNSDDTLPMGDDEERDRKEKGEKEGKGENTGGKGEREDRKEEKEDGDGGGVDEGEDEEVESSTNEDLGDEKDELNSANATEEVEIGAQDLSGNVDAPEGFPQDEATSNTTYDPSTEESDGSNKDDNKEPRQDQNNELNEGSQYANSESNNGNSPTGSHHPKAAEDMLGSQGFSDKEASNTSEKEKVMTYVIAIVGSVAFVLLLGIAHKTRTSLITRRAGALPRHHEGLEAYQNVSLASGDSCIFDASADSTLEAAFSFLDRNANEPQIPTTLPKRGITSFFTRIVLSGRGNGAGKTATDSDSVLARCENLSIESPPGDLVILNGQIQRKDLFSWRRGRWNQRAVGSVSRINGKEKLPDVGGTVDRILRQIEESPCESELSEEDLSISEFTESSCDEIDNEDVRERFKEFESKLNAEFAELSAHMLDLTDQSTSPNCGCVSSDASSFRGISDHFETRAGCEFVYRGGAGSSGPDSPTTSDAESLCSSTVDGVRHDSWECEDTSSVSVLDLRSSYEQSKHS